LPLNVSLPPALVAQTGERSAGAGSKSYTPPQM